MGTPGFVTDPRTQRMNKILGRTGMTGDGIRFVRTEDKIMATVPKTIGQDIAHYSNPAQLVLGNQAPPSPTIISKDNAKHSKFMNPANVNRDHLSSRFSAYHMQRQRLPSTDKTQTIKRYRRSSPAQEAKLAGVYSASRRGLGGGALDTLTTSRPVQMVALGILGWMGVTAIKSFAPSKDDDSPAGAPAPMWS